MTDKIKIEIYHVLFVDDDADEIKETLKQYSGSDGKAEIIQFVGKNYFFHFCTSLNEALDILKFTLHPVQVVVLDYLFPGEEHDGLWLLKKIMHMSPDIPVIMTSGPSYNPETAHKVGLLQADCFLDKALFFQKKKPQEFEELLNQIDHVIYKKRKQPELHDRKHLELVESFADKGYDEEEQSYPATIAYYLFENEEILKIVNRIKDKKGQLAICDVGCGTGRIEELILSEFNLERDRISITGIDFSGRMLKRLKDKELHSENEFFRFERASAESLELFDRESFDLVILGFGFPSYTKYHLTMGEAARICRSGGYGLFSVYNEDSVIYDAEKNVQWDENERPIAAIAELITGKLNVGGERNFDCETFTIEQFSKLVNRQGFEIEEINTFPTLHASLPNSAVSQMPDCLEPLDGFPFCKLFSRKLYELDKAFSRATPKKGHYIVVSAKKT